jgi:hypothetical protein
MPNQIINVGAAANDGTGDAERNAWIKANANFADLYDFQGRIINPRIIFAGDSKAVLGGNFEGESWAAWALTLAGVEYQYSRADNCGVSGALCDNTTTTAAANGAGTSTVLGFAHDSNVAVIVARVAARVAAGDNVVVWFQVGTNSTGDDTAHLASLRKVINACRTAGAQLFLVNDVPPKVAAQPSASNIGSINFRLEEWAKTQADVKVIKHHVATIDPASAAGDPIGGSGGLSGAMTKEGIHDSYRGAYHEGKMMAPQIAALFRAAPMRAGAKSDVYTKYFGDGAYPTTALCANMNKNPFSNGTSGTDSSSKAGSASVTGSVPDGMELTGALTGTVNIAFSQVANDWLNTLLGRTDLTCVRMTLTGTPTANDRIKLHEYQTGSSRYPLINGSQSIRSRVILKANGLTGTQGIAAVMPSQKILNNGDASIASNSLPAISEVMQFYDLDKTVTPAGGPPAYITPPDLGFEVVLINGVAASGSIDLVYKDCRLLLAAPAPLS